MTLDNLYNDRDKIINEIIDRMDYGTRDNLADLFLSAVEKVVTDKKRWTRSGFIQDIMVKEDLIDFVGQGERGPIVTLTTRGTLIKESGGWLNHVNIKKRNKKISDFLKWGTFLLSATATIIAITQTKSCTQRENNSQPTVEKLQCRDTVQTTQKDSLGLPKLDSTSTEKK